MSNAAIENAELYAVVGEFKNPGALLKAAESVRRAGYKCFDAYSPFPIHGMDDAMGIGQSKLGWYCLVGGIIGCVGGFLLQAWVSAIAYPLTISGKPLISWPAFVPVTFELTILIASFVAVFGMFALNRLPKPYHPMFNYSKSRTLTSHGFCLAIESKDPAFDVDRASRFLESIGAASVELVNE